MDKVWLDIDLDRLASNYKLIKEIEPNKDVLGIIKADAYGCGALEISKSLIELGVKFFGVSCLKEALELREGGVKEDILILSSIHHSDYETAFKNNIQITLSDLEDLEFIENSDFPNPCVQIKIDTGMGRIGFTPKEGMKVLRNRNSLKKVNIVGVFTHFASADLQDGKEYTLKQIELFKPFEKLKDIKYIHSQNTGGIINFSKECGGNLIRPGMMLYGFSPLNEKLKPIATLKTRITHLKKVTTDSFISYGSEGVAKSGTTVATVSIGYADGYSRLFSNIGTMWIKGVPCKVLGKVCMDSTMIEIPKELRNSVSLGMEVDVLGDNPVKELSKVGISPYEFIVSITQRVIRYYHKSL